MKRRNSDREQHQDQEKTHWEKGTSPSNGSQTHAASNEQTHDKQHNGAGKKIRSSQPNRKKDDDMCKTKVEEVVKGVSETVYRWTTVKDNIDMHRKVGCMVR